MDEPQGRLMGAHDYCTQVRFSMQYMIVNFNLFHLLLWIHLTTTRMKVKMMMMMIPSTLILNGVNSLCRLCLRAPIYFNRMCNIILFCVPANTILTTVYPGAVV